MKFFELLYKMFNKIICSIFNTTSTDSRLPVWGGTGDEFQMGWTKNTVQTEMETSKPGASFVIIDGLMNSEVCKGSADVCNETAHTMAI